MTKTTAEKAKNDTCLKTKQNKKNPKTFFFQTQTQNVMIEESQMLEWLAEL